MSQENKTMLIPGGSDKTDILHVRKSIPFSSATIITPEEYNQASELLKETLEKEKIQVKIVQIQEDNKWIDFFDIIHHISSLQTSNDKHEILMFTSTKDYELRTIATTAAFANGLKAITYENKTIKLLPQFKFNYYSSITDKKMEILKILEEDITCCKSLEELSQRTKMSLPLISYHINGNLKSEGLKKMGLVETKEEQGKIIINLSIQGRMLLKGILDEDN